MAVGDEMTDGYCIFTVIKCLSFKQQPLKSLLHSKSNIKSARESVTDERLLTKEIYPINVFKKNNIYIYIEASNQLPP